jgi:hypothetical protein
MPKFLADENFDERVLRELKRRLSDMEVVRVQDVQLQGVKDELILEWAASQRYVLLTHDAKTMTRHGRERIAKGLLFPGMVVIKRKSPIGRIVRELEILIACTRQDEWEDRFWFVPL